MGKSLLPSFDSRCRSGLQAGRECLCPVHRRKHVHMHRQMDNPKTMRLAPSIGWLEA